ncbi:MAG: PEP-CTERM sorting domain-containing protein [Hydrogenophilales bacterium 16-64-46]|nr:MAG: PEP-CTERM sorting domain-containing protein [Hydrogenophilales bacterium 12-64-13]OYZ04731.1 MAG: PEP-CTERM sorting domain-containing protein [Hydrogenophilales bacterium 16-64-46]OZA38417.1 MAG: PEP-CTERM sorting domain-containing protein [Hydrogenophilales bacterium 17-64-34]HQS99776.1 choice-of-anchor I family protein [Thiobacillus sp.]
MQLKPLPALLAGLALAAAAPSASALGFTEAWTYEHSSIASEIAAFDALTGTVWVAGVSGVDVLDAVTGTLVQHIDTTAFGSINSVAISNGVAAFAMEDAVRTDNGTVQFYSTTSLTNTGSVAVGPLPDMLTFTADGSQLLVANEGSPVFDDDAELYTGADASGSVSIIDMSTLGVTSVSFAGVTQSGSALRTGLTTTNLEGDALSLDFEPEYIAVNAAGTLAYVTLQEANGLGIIDLTTGTATEVIGLGTKDFSLPGNEIDPNHKDGVIELRASSVVGLYQPDAIASYEVNGTTYLVMANEGDTLEDDGDKERAKDTGLTGFDADLEQLNVSTADSTDGSLVTFGGRSFSIRDEAGNIVYDSGNLLEAKAIEAGIYNDSRSDDKGVEPEGVTIMTIGGRTYAFVGLERTTASAVAIFDISDPVNTAYVDMIVGANDISPEGLLGFVKDGVSYLAIAHEVSNTTTVYQLSAPVPEAETYAMMLAGLGLVGFMAKRRRRA